MELREIDAGEYVMWSGQALESACFPESCALSLVVETSKAVAFECAIVGKEGMIGLPAVLGAPAQSTSAICQIPGKYWHISSDDFRQLLSQQPEIEKLMKQYALVLFDQIARTSACNCLHSLDQRFIRRLLLIHDRSGAGDTVALTQRFLADMLGVQRSGVSLTANKLRRKKLIDYSYGKISIKDRKGLERLSCECYRKTVETLEVLDSLSPPRDSSN